MARKVVGVGSVGTRANVALLVGRDNSDPLFLQFKEAQDSVLAPFAGKSLYKNQGQRVVEGQRLMQATSDIFLGWVRIIGLDGNPHELLRPPALGRQRLRRPSDDAAAGLRGLRADVRLDAWPAPTPGRATASPSEPT